jgi:hypothetical protein
LQLVILDNKLRIKDEKINVNYPELNKNIQKYKLAEIRV